MSPPTTLSKLLGLMGYKLEKLPPLPSRAEDKSKDIELPDGGSPNESNQEWFCGAQGFPILGSSSAFYLVTWRDLDLGLAIVSSPAPKGTRMRMVISVLFVEAGS